MSQIKGTDKNTSAEIQEGVNAASELAKVPKSDGTVSWNATALAQINTEVDNALNTIVPASPTAGSLNDILSKAAGGNTFSKSTDSLEMLSDKAGAFSGDGGAAQDDSAKASLDLAHTDLDAIIAVTETGEGVGTYSYLDAGGEQTILEQVLTTRRKIESIWLDLVNMTQNGTIKLYHKIDGVNYREFDSMSFTVATDSDGILIEGFTVNYDWKITYTEGANEGAARNIPYNVIWTEKE